jgi:hypothetical protein
MNARVPLLVSVSFLDTSHAMYDREDGVYIGAENVETEIEDDPEVRLFVEINPLTRSVLGVEILPQDISVSEPYETYK